MTPKQQLQSLIREALTEVDFETQHEDDELRIVKMIVDMARHYEKSEFGAAGLKMGIVNIRKLSEQLLNMHETGREIPAESVNENTEDESEEIKALKLIVMYASKAKSVQDPALKQRTLVTIEAMANKMLGKNEPVGSPLDKYRESK